LIYVELRVPNPILALRLFREPMVSVGLTLTLLTGFAMFGAIIFVPLYFQGVLGASATSSGTFLTPMMLGVVAGATISGQILSRTGGYFRIHALLGIGIMALGCFLFTSLGSDSTYRVAVFFIVILGIGLGSTSPMLTLAVQNFTPPTTIGAATSLTQFARTVGGLIGLSVLGSVLSSRFVDRLDQGILQNDINVPLTALEELKNNPRSLMDSGSESSVLGSTATEMGTDSFNNLIIVLKDSLSGAISDVFNVALIILLVSIGVALLLNKTGFRKMKGPAKS
jgi:ABC-type transport system involved in multi-copper enzyme maturation permease subunit